MWYRASAPGSLMLMGEYAVLQGKPALVCAVDKRLQVTLKPREDKEIIINSLRYGEWRGNLNKLNMAEPFRFVTACLYLNRQKIKTGFELEIQADFSDKLGFGSSSAVTVATLGALFAWLELECSPLDLIREARRVVRKVQGLGSGADVAAAVLGGVVAYRATPLSAEKFPQTLPLTVVYSGAKTPTAIAVKKVQAAFAEAPALFKKLCEAIGSCVDEALQALRQKDLPRLGKAMNIQQGLMQSLGVSTPLLDNLIENLRLQPAIQGAKISGSGLGDCVLGLGDAALEIEEREGVKQLQVRVSREGMSIEKEG